MPIGHDANDAALNTAIRDPEHLIRFLKTSGREFFVMRAEDLIRALPDFQNGVETIQQLVSCYRDYRRTQPSGFVEDIVVKDPLTQQERTVVGVDIMKDETLTQQELDDLIYWATKRRDEEIERLRKLKNVRMK